MGLYIGSFNRDGDTLRVFLHAKIDAVQLAERGGQTVDHRPIPAGALELSISGSVVDHRGEVVGGGQCQDAVRAVTSLAIPAATRDRILSIWERWHLNGMRPGCVHQPPIWQCTNHVTPVRNGWPVLAESGLAYPNRGDVCVKCGRNRWDEPTDWCHAVEPPYRYGTAWLYEPLPGEVASELADIFGTDLRKDT